MRLILLGRLSALPTPSFPAEALSPGRFRFSLRLDVYLRLRSCKSSDAFVISSLPSLMSETLQMAGPLRSADIAPLHRCYGPVRLPLVFGRLPGFAGYTAYLAPAISRRDEEGLSSCSACPCHRAVAFTPPRWRCRIGQISAPHAASTFRGHIYVHHVYVHCHYGPATRSLPKGDLVDRLQDFDLSPPCYPNYGAPDFRPGRSTSC